MLAHALSDKNMGLAAALRAAADPVRLRILVLLAGGELTVKDLTEVLGHSQPRTSQHLKTLADAGLVQRFSEGSWAHFRLAETAETGTVTGGLLAAVDAADPILARDRDRLAAIKRRRENEAQAYFRAHAAEWDRIRSLHVSDRAVETALAAHLGPGPFKLFVDLGTGTGRMLDLFANRYERGLGIDINPAMLGYARATLERRGIRHAQVRRGDIYDLGLAEGAADAVILHQVLHYLADPARALAEAARVTAPGGRVLVADFAPHGLDFLRAEHAHARLGFEPGLVRQWLTDAGLAMRETRELPPSARHRQKKLTVLVWVAERPIKEARS